jgi:hypothetical protein
MKMFKELINKLMKTNKESNLMILKELDLQITNSIDQDPRYIHFQNLCIKENSGKITLEELFDLNNLCFDDCKDPGKRKYYDPYIRFRSLNSAESLGKLSFEEITELDNMTANRGFSINLSNFQPREMLGRRSACCF